MENLQTGNAQSPEKLLEYDMKNKNTINLLEAVANHVFWILLAMLWYRAVFFIALPRISATWSKAILWSLVVVLSTAGWLSAAETERSTVSLVTDALLPYELYTVLAYHVYFPWLVWISIAISGIAVIILFGLVMFSPVRDHSRKQSIIRRRLRHAFVVSRVMVAACLLLLIVPIGVRLVSGRGVLETNVKSVPANRESDEWSARSNIDVLRLLEEKEWKQLSGQERLDVLGVVLNIEIRYLGINHELYLNSATIGGDTLAYYSHKGYEIVIDLDHLCSAEAVDALRSLCHECYHSYQYQMIDLYESVDVEYQDMIIFRYVEDYIEENAGHLDGSQNWLEYYTQTSEITARRYASEAVAEYYEIIEEYTSKN